MTYKDQFVVEVKCNGKILRVQDDFVRLPFGSEYSLYLKNLNSRTASVMISIDGEDVLDHHSLILKPNTHTELEGFLRGTIAQNRFKFIQKTEKIQEHRGDKIDDGIIRVEFAYEKPKPEIKISEEHHYHYHNNPFNWNYDNHFLGNSTAKYGSLGDVTERSFYSHVVDGGDTVQASCTSNITMDSLGVSEPISKPLVDEGITVKGSECDQRFNYSSVGELGQSEVIIIRLKGMTANATVTRPVTVRSKLACSTCGKKSNSSFKYCSECGTFLE